MIMLLIKILHSEHEEIDILTKQYWIKIKFFKLNFAREMLRYFTFYL